MAEDTKTPPDQLALLAGDGSMTIRRAAASNPSTPAEALQVMRRAGSSDDLTSSTSPDPTLDSETLEELARGGDWARWLAARHPATPVKALDQLASDPVVTIRRQIAARDDGSITSQVLDKLLTDVDPDTRSRAAAQPNASKQLIGLLVACGCTADLSTKTEPTDAIEPAQLERLAGMGFWARLLAARHPKTPTEMLDTLSRDRDWRVRSALADNPAASASMLDGLSTLDDMQLHARLVQHPNASGSLLSKLAKEESHVIRTHVASHANTPADILTGLLEDGSHAVRAAAASNPVTPPLSIERLVAAGSSPDLATTLDARSSIPHEVLTELGAGGPWARRLAATHPDTPPDVLADLAVDGDFLLREMVADHPKRPSDRIALLVRAGSSEDLQSYGPCDTDMTPDELANVCDLGPWARRLVARHPNTDADLLARLASDSDWQVRRSVARHGHTPDEALIGLAQDFAADVRWSVLNREHTLEEVLELLARDELATIRLGVAADPRTPETILNALAIDLDEDVRREASQRLERVP